MGIKNKRKTEERISKEITQDDIRYYDDVFGTERGFHYIEPMGMLAYDAETKKLYFCLSEDREVFIDRINRSLEAGENLFVKEWKEWTGYKEGVMY